MSLLVLSDIHLERGPFTLPDDIGEFDVAVFAGDVDRPIANSIDWIDLQTRARSGGGRSYSCPETTNSMEPIFFPPSRRPGA